MSGDGKVSTSKEMKKSYKSKTMLFNGLAAAMAVMFPEALAMVPYLGDPETQVLAMGIANMVLRAFTNKGVEVPFVK